MAVIGAKEPELDYVTRGEEAKVTEVGHAIDGVGLQIGAGSFVTTLGHSDSGKSTLTKALNGILLSSNGAVLVSDTNIMDSTKLLDIRHEVGMAFQNPDNQIIANLVEGGVSFGPENLGVPTEEIWQRVDAALKTVGTTALRLKSPSHLSDGQKQRVAIASVMAICPECIVPDESTAMLNPNDRKEVIQTVTELNHSKGVMIMLVTHYTEEVIGADHLVAMDDGEVIMDGTPREASAWVEELKRLYLDVPQATKLAYELKQRGVSLPNSVFTMKELVETISLLRREN